MPKQTTQPKQKTDGGLKAGQVKILKLLAKKDGLTRSEIVEKAATPPNIQDWLGPNDETSLKEMDEKYNFKSLLSLGLVKSIKKEGENKRYYITPKGRQVASKV